MDSDCLQKLIDDELDRLRDAVLKGEGVTIRDGCPVTKVPLQLNELMVEWGRLVREQRRERDRQNDNDSGPSRSYGELGGKISEEICWALAHVMDLGREACGIERPDLVIRPKNEQHYGPDLGEHLYVKACCADDDFYDWSWTISKEDPAYVSPFPEDIIVLCRFRGDKEKMRIDRVQVLGWVPAKEMKELDKWRPARRIRHKVCIYAKEMTGLTGAYKVDGLLTYVDFDTNPMAGNIRPLVCP